MLNQVRQRVTTYPGTGQVVTTPGASCNVHDNDDDWPYRMLLTCYITSIITTQGYSGIFREEFNIFKTLILTPKIRRILEFGPRPSFIK